MARKDWKYGTGKMAGIWESKKGSWLWIGSIRGIHKLWHKRKPDSPKKLIDEFTSYKEATKALRRYIRSSSV